ncbi:eomesodermin homolog b [Engraulis encrasicolus]|uniref:eomesodermin homolog b n=1 Tax=Engraulis encrasicolus TaxID=184585 RepID=UPI002FD3AC4C
MMQLGEGQLDETSINAQKVLYDSSDNNNRTQSSSEIHFHLSPSRRKHEAKKFLSHAENREMLGEGQSDAIILSKDSVDNRKSSLTTEEDPSDGSRHIIIDGISPDRYFISPSSAQDMNPCSLFPYTGSDGTRYSASLHYSSVLPSPGFSSPVYSGRGQCGSGYQFGQSPGCLYPSYQGSAPGVGSMSHAGTGTGLRAQVYLCNRALWLKFHRHQTEMIITKQGRRMFPFLSFNITGLRLNAHYNVFVEIVLADPNHWRFQGGKWVTCGKADNNMQGNKVYVHPESPNTGAHWMRQEISFGKLKLTNNKGASSTNSQMVVLQSLHKYQPRLHIVEVGEDGVEDLNRESKTQTFTFPENQFIAVTAYQNTDITQLKIDHNPFAKGFRDNYDSMYTAVPEGDRLTPSPTDSPRSHQIVPGGARYAMQPFLQDQLVASQSRFYHHHHHGHHGHAGERAVPQTGSLLSPPRQPEDMASASAQRWFVSPVQQAGGGGSAAGGGGGVVVSGGGGGGGGTPKLELGSYEGDYSSSLLPYGIKPLPLPASHSFGYYSDSAFASVAAGWGSRSMADAATAAAASAYQRKVATALPWSPRPSPTPTGFTDDQMCDKDKARGGGGGEEGTAGVQTPAWLETSSSLKALDGGGEAGVGVYSGGCKRRRLSPDGSSVEGSPPVKAEEMGPPENLARETTPSSKGMGYYAFYTST